MLSKVLILGGTSQRCSPELSGDYEVQVCQNLSEALQSASSAHALIFSEADETEAVNFLQDAFGVNPSLRIALFVPGDSSEVLPKLAETIPMLLLPAEAPRALVLANLRQYLRPSRKYSSQTTHEQTVNGTVSALYEILTIIDPYSASLGQRLRYACELFCKAAKTGLSWELETAALLGEVGILTIPTRAIIKAHSGQDLPPFESDMLAHLAERGADLLAQIPSFEAVAEIIRFQGKNYDGTGLPNQLISGQEIPLGARILRILNDLFKLKEGGRTQDEAITEMLEREGCYDPTLLKVAGDCFAISLPSKIAASSVPTTVNDLRPGQLLVSNIETADGVLVLRDGQVISPKLIHKLRNFAFTSGIREPFYVIDLLESCQMATSFHKLSQSETSFFVKPK
jgi:response regulator RpfG family c-di-GMP phosphodiesterase